MRVQDSLRAEVSVATRANNNPLAQRMRSSLLITAAEILGEGTMKSFQSVRFAGLVAIMMVLFVSPARAQDPVKTDPAHYKLELENDRVRILHVSVEPNRKLEVNELGDAVIVPLRDYESTLKTANGETKVERVMGKPAWVSAGRREVEAGARGVDALLIEIKPAAK
jgi:hypothetical protein